MNRKFPRFIFFRFAKYYIYTRFPARIENDPSNAGLLLVGLGIFVAIGSLWIAGPLLVIGGILILIDVKS